MYIEIFVLFNIYIDFLIILMTSILLKKKIKIKQILFSSLFGGLSSIILFFNITIIELLILNFIISIILIKITFKTLKALFYFYLNAIILGGLIFYLNNILKLNTKDNYILLLLLTPILLIIYKNKIKDFKANYNFNYQIKFNYNKQNIILNSFLDTGNTLIDPYFNKPVILINEDILKTDKYFYIPYSTITEDGIIKAIHLNEIEIVGVKKIKDVVIGLLPKKLKLNKVDCLLNNKTLEE